MPSETILERKMTSFLDLPPEVRCEIYRYLFATNEAVTFPKRGRIFTTFRTTTFPNPKELHFLDDLGSETPNHRSILRTCRLTYQEALPISYEESNFLYIFHEVGQGGAQRIGILSRYVHLVRSISVGVWYFGTQCNAAVQETVSNLIETYANTSNAQLRTVKVFLALMPGGNTRSPYFVARRSDPVGTALVGLDKRVKVVVYMGIPCGLKTASLKIWLKIGYSSSGIGYWGRPWYPKMGRIQDPSGRTICEPLLIG